MTEAYTDADANRATVRVFYTRGAYSRDAPTLERGTEEFELSRDLRCFADETFEMRDVTVEHALDVAYVELTDEPVEISTENFDYDANDVVRVADHVYSRLQGPRADSRLPYDGSETRSMAVGDLVVVDGTIVMVGSGYDFPILGDLDDVQDDDSDDEPELVADGGEEIRSMHEIIGSDERITDAEAEHYDDVIDVEENGRRIYVQPISGARIGLDPQICEWCGDEIGTCEGVIGRISHGFGAANKEEFRFCDVDCRAAWREDDDEDEEETTEQLVEYAEETDCMVEQTSLDDFGAAVDDDLPIAPVSPSTPALVADGGREPVEVVDEFLGEVRRRVEVSSEKVGLYELLVEIIESDEAVSVRDLMPADLAVECDDLVDVLDLLDSVDRGLVDVNGVAYGLSYVLDMKHAIEAYRDRDPVTLVAVGCSASKHEDAELLPAGDRYKGGYWTNKREYYEAVGDDARIISAEHDVLAPSTPIAYYETSVGDLEGIPVDVDDRLPNGDDVATKLDLWAARVYEGLAAWLRDVSSGIDPRDVELQILLGRSYEDPLRERGVFDALRARGSLDVSFPFREVDGLTGIGKQREWLGNEAERHAGEEPELVADGGWVEEPSTTWCPECQRERVSCAHLDGVATDGGELVDADKTPDEGVGRMDYQERAEELVETTVLKPREADVRALKELGLSHAEIAEELGISKSSVDEYSRRINDRLARARETVKKLNDSQPND